MPRPEKVQAVADIKERIEAAQAVYLAEYAGLSVKDQQALRRNLRESGAEFRVVKMTMARLAAAELEIDTLDELLLGQTGMAFADGDPAAAAKVLKNFAKDHATFMVKGGLLGLEYLPPEKIAELADLEPREVLLAMLAGAFQAPTANLAGLLAALPRNTASVIQQLLEKKEAGEFAGAVDEGADTSEAEVAVEAPEATDDAVPEAEAPEADAADEADTPEAEATDDTEESVEDGAEDEGDEPEADSADEAPEVKDAAADKDAAEEADETEDDADVAAESSADDGDESDDQADEASEDDATEE